MSSALKVVELIGHVVKVYSSNDFLPLFKLFHIIGIVDRWSMVLMLIMRQIQILILGLILVEIILLLEMVVVQRLCVEEIAG